MLNRFTVSALLKSVIAATALVIIAMFALNSWESWSRWQMSGRIVKVTEASAALFKAMANLRSDRVNTLRHVNAEKPLDAVTVKYMHDMRDTEMAGLSRALELLPAMEFAQNDKLVPELDRLNKTLAAQQAEFWSDQAKPKTQRRLALGKDYSDTITAALTALDTISAALVSSVNHQDATIDQLLMIKQTAWLMRNTAGEVSTIVGNALNSGKITPESQLAYTKYMGGTDASWKALQLTVAGMALPQALSAALTATQSAYFDPQYLTLADQLVDAVAKGQKGEMTSTEWSPMSVGRMNTAITVADGALDAAKEHANLQQSLALRSLILQLSLLVVALVATITAMATITRRVIGPLNTIRDAMLQVASGDLAVETGYGDRKDEIGALAGALETFKSQAQEKLAIEAQEHERNTAAATREQAIDARVTELEGT